jgi:endogenous inhibitor of DNA gyrase (YacG/DUF329 family)
MLCPVCKREFDSATSPALPFCNERCRTIDLGRWLGEVYQLPVFSDPEADQLPDENSAETDTGADGPS